VLYTTLNSQWRHEHAVATTFTLYCLDISLFTLYVEAFAQCSYKCCEGNIIILFIVYFGFLVR